MKKEILFGALALLISVGAAAQNPVSDQTQIKTKKQLKIEARQQKMVHEQVQSGDPIMTQTQTRTRDKVQSGDPIMTQTQTRTRDKVQSGDPIMTKTQSGARMQNNVQSGDPIMTKNQTQARSAAKNNGPAKSVKVNRPSTVKRTGAGHR